MEKNILILCCGYPYTTDSGFGYHVSKVLEKMKLPENIDFMEVGLSACMIPHVIEGKDKMIVVDVFHTHDKPGTVVRLRAEDVPLLVHGRTDTAKLHLIDTLGEIRLTGKCPETVFIGVVPIDIKTESENLTPEIESKIPIVIQMILKEVKISPSD